MANSKIHINLKQGILEVEGSEEFVKKMYKDFKDNIGLDMEDGGSVAKNKPPAGERNPPAKKKKAAAKKKASAGKQKGGSTDPSLVKDLDLTGGGKKESLRDFASKYVIKTNMERNLIFAYYLCNVLNLKEIGVNHIFTCYRNIPGTKLPGNIKQSLYDTSAKGWIAVESIDNDITVPVMGINHIEHDLPKTGDS